MSVTRTTTAAAAAARFRQLFTKRPKNHNYHQSRQGIQDLPPATRPDRYLQRPTAEWNADRRSSPAVPLPDEILIACGLAA
jgi:hypothetical protein